MTPDYRTMAAGMLDLGMAVLRTEARLLEHWAELVQECGTRFADDVDARRDAARQDGRAVGLVGYAGAAHGAARDYVRGVASLGEVAMLDLATDLDSVRAARRER
jgi:hypothetical protein